MTSTTKNKNFHPNAVVFSLLFATALSRGVWIEAFLGWGVAFANHLSNFLLMRGKFRSEADVQRFSVFSVIRLLTFLGVVFIILTFLGPGQMIFAQALLVSYAIFMIADLVWIWRSQKVS